MALSRGQWGVLAAAWVVFLLCGVALLLSPMLLIGASYYPNAPYAPYVLFIAGASLVAAGVSLILAIRVTVSIRRTPASRLWKEIGAFLAAVLCAAVVARIVIEPAPDSFVQHAGFDAYRIPNDFTYRSGAEPGESAYVSFRVCLKDLGRDRDTVLPDFLTSCDPSDVALSKRPITSNFAVYYFLDREQGVARSGDVIRSPERLAMRRVAGDGWTGFTTSDGEAVQSPGATHLILDGDNRVVLFSDCVHGSPRCTVYARTRLDVLQYEHREGQQFQPELWRRLERDLLGLLDSWRVDRG